MEFRKLVLSHLLPEFCGAPKRNYDPAGFREASIRVSEADAANFARAWQAGLIEHLGEGVYRSPMSCASEQFFWEGLKTEQPRTITLWLEPIITVATLARLHFDFGWPKHLLGTQSADWAFDVTAFLSAGNANEYIACEVKKTVSEVSQLIDLMQLYATRNDISESSLKAKEKNAYRKVLGLRARRAPIFWAVGPDLLSRVFNITYGAAGEVHMEETTEARLSLPTV